MQSIKKISNNLFEKIKKSSTKAHGISKSVTACVIASSLALLPIDAQATPDLNAISKKTGVSVEAIQYALSQATYQQKIIDAITRPSEAKPWWQYRKIFIQNERINKGVSFYLEHEQSLKEASRLYGVPPEIICAIIGVETFYGRNMGNWSVLDALYTLGFNYPKREAYFSVEFANFIKLCMRENWNLKAIKGSYAGAMGMGQFMPSSYLDYAVNFDSQGGEDLFNSPIDAIGSVANYFKGHGWLQGRGICYAAHVHHANTQALISKEWNLTAKELYDAGVTTKVTIPSAEKVRLYAYALEDGSTSYLVALNNFKSITRYNTSPLYARAVFELSEYIRMGYVKAKQKMGITVNPEGRRP